VDDIPANLIALEAVLQSTQYELIQATSGAQAIQLLEEHDFALILLDVQMPEMDGFETARRIKSNARTRNIPIIFITAIHTEDPHIRRGYEVGGVDYFGKPFDPEVLKLKVGIYTELYMKSMAIKEKERAAHRSAAELNTVLQSIPDAVYVCDERGITRCNDVALRMFGLEESEALGKPFSELANQLEIRNVRTGERIALEDHSFFHALRGEEHVTTVMIRNFRTQEDLVVGLAAAPIYFEGKIVGAVVVNTDLTDSLSAA
jgi:two-component system, sporulation sensor kinase E